MALQGRAVGSQDDGLRTVGIALARAGVNNQVAGAKVGYSLVTPKWANDVPIYVRAMVLAPNKLFIAGPLDRIDESTIDGRLIELMIELRNVSVKSGAFVLPRISFQIESGEYAVLMETTGHGKTTLLESICGLRRVAEGQILIHGCDVTRWSPADREIGYVPQDLALFPTLTVREHLEFAMRLRKMSVTVIVKRTQELSEVLGIGHLLTRSITGLSGSMLKWIHVAVTLRALLLSVFALLKSYGPQRARS